MWWLDPSRNTQGNPAPLTRWLTANVVENSYVRAWVRFVGLPLKRYGRDGASHYGSHRAHASCPRPNCMKKMASFGYVGGGRLLQVSLWTSFEKLFSNATRKMRVASSVT